MFRAALIQWLRSPLLTGWQALPFAIAAVALPTALRIAVEGVVAGCEFTPYLPFVLLSAIFLRSWQAGAVVAASVAIMSGLFSTAHKFGLPCFLSSASMFILASAVMIGVAVVVRSVIAFLQKRGADETLGGVVFSLERGEVWASWYGQSAPVLLGSQRRVSEMMKDFLKQEELGKRLSRR